MVREFQEAATPTQSPQGHRMFVRYRRTGGVFALLAFAAFALAAIVLTVVVGAAVLVVVIAIAAVALVVRAVLPRSWYYAVPPAAPWPHETFDATVVNRTASSGEGDLLRLDSDKGA